LARIHESRGSTDVGDALCAKIAFVDAVHAKHIGVALAFDGGPVVAPHVDIETVVGGIAQAQGNARRVPHDFLRNAAHVDAGAAEAMRFDHRGLCAVFGRALRAGKAAAAAADADEIE
jgi:hypothetical protein